MVGQRAPPLIALTVDADPVVWRSERVKRVDLQIGTLLNYSASDQPTLGNTNQVDLLACEVWIVVQLVANRRCLPEHALKLGCYLPIPDFYAFDNCLVIDSVRDHRHPATHLRARSINPMKQCNRRHRCRLSASSQKTSCNQCCLLHNLKTNTYNARI